MNLATPAANADQTSQKGLFQILLRLIRDGSVVAALHICPWIVSGVTSFPLLFSV
jgi:hypothetical protein